MTDAAFLRAILDRPDLDGPRLVYADWLDERGDPRGAFIRSQCGGELAPVRLTWLIPFEKMLGAQPHQCERRATPGEVVVSGPALTLTFRRGFVAEVRVPTLDVLLGGPCGRCEGGRWRNHVWDTADGICPACSGTGRTPGVLKELFRAAPIERVTVGDREPLTGNILTGCRWSHGQTRDCSMPYELPKELFDLLPTGPACTYVRDAGVDWTSRLSVRDYDTLENGHAALSASLVSLGRKAAGLPKSVEATRV